MKFILPLLFLSSIAGAIPEVRRGDFLIGRDPCVATVKQAILTIQVSSNKQLPVSSVELLSAKEDRSYKLTFDGLVGSYNLILDNDPNNRCFFVRQSFEF